MSRWFRLIRDISSLKEVLYGIKTVLNSRWPVKMESYVGPF